MFNGVGKKLILYGLGKIFNEYKQYICWENVIAVTDKYIEEKKDCYNGILMIKVEEIQNMAFDYIIVFTDRYFESIKTELIDSYFILEEKILPWRVLLSEKNKDYYNRIVTFYRKFINSKKINRVLDICMKYLPQIFFTQFQISKRESFEIDGIGKIKYPFYKKNLYSNVYAKYEKNEQKYDLILLWKDYEKYITLDTIVKSGVKHILWTIPYQLEQKKEFEKKEELSLLGTIRKYFLLDHIIYEFERKEDKERIDCEIFVVTHKQYNVQNNQLYRPICVGKQYINKRFLSEHMGENIVDLNEFINECTALYWIWKNTNSEFVGLNHYRRYFYNNEIKNRANYLTIETIEEIFKEGYDLILPQETVLSVTVLENIESSVGKELSDKARNIVRKMMIKQVPEYVKAFDDVMAGTLLFARNMFVTNRVVLNSYCSWLFSFLIEATKELDVSSCDSHRKRTMGYFAETMWTVWLLKQELKIWELPIVES